MAAILFMKEMILILIIRITAIIKKNVATVITFVDIATKELCRQTSLKCVVSLSLRRGSYLCSATSHRFLRVTFSLHCYISRKIFLPSPPPAVQQKITRNSDRLSPLRLGKDEGKKVKRKYLKKTPLLSLLRCRKT